MNLNQIKQKLTALTARYDLAKQQVRIEKQALTDVRQRIEYITSAQQLVQEVAEGVQSQAHRQITSVVTRCLKTVFGEDSYEFKIVFEKKRGKTEARLVFVRNGLEMDPTEAAGGGTVDVAAFALRLACLLLLRPKKRLLLVMDEPFKFVSREYRPALRELLQTLAQEMKIQVVLVTHIPELQIGKVIELD